MNLTEIFTSELKKFALTEGFMRRAQTPAYRAMIEAPASSGRSKRMIDLLADIAVRRAGIPKGYRK